MEAFFSYKFLSRVFYEIWKTKQLFPVNELEFLITKHTNDGKFDDEFGDLSGYKILSFEHGIQESQTQSI